MLKIQQKFNKYLLNILPIINSISYKNELTLVVSFYQLIPILFFLKNHSHCQYKVLSDICVVDYVNRKKRFTLIYNLLSLQFNHRLKIKILIDEFQTVNSITSLYNAAEWMEREAWDMYGVLFNDHPDLRRILTDYGFEGHPLRKDFPLSGFLEVYYNELKKRVVYEPINLAQQYRLFEFNTPWDKKVF